MSGSTGPASVSHLHLPVPAFDVCGDLPRGVTVLEASAGTGKTFTIAALVARYVAERNVPIERMLVVTFTRMATGELRERVRERLVTAERGLADVLAGVAPDRDDDVLNHLADAGRTEVEQRRRRLAQALADFDAATISTTHGFCQHVLAQLGVAGDVERDVTFLEDWGDLVEEVVSDLYLRKFLWAPGEPTLSLGDARRVARVAVANPLAPIEPPDTGGDRPRETRARLARAVREEVDRRKRRRKVLTYDDLLTRLATTLADPERGPAACARMRERYTVALVDEFQDTDPVQWAILRDAFAGRQPRTGRDPTLVLIGDPKQAVYAFRGADVHAYLQAARTAGTHATLGVNWRSDQGLIAAYDALFAGSRLGHEGIAYRTVRAATANVEPRLLGAPVAAPLRVRVLARDGRVPLTPKGYITRRPGEAAIAEDLAADVVRLLEAQPQIERRARDGRITGRTPLRPADVAVLVRTHKQAALVRDALEAVAVPAVINGAGSVFGTDVAVQWLRLLEALEQPTSPPRARAAALSLFLGWTAQRLATADEGDLDAVHDRLHRWADVLRRRGVAALLETVTAEESLPARVLARTDGERALTDLRHVGQLLHAAMAAEGLGVTALAAWLRQRIAEASRDTGSEERSRRLDSDVEAVQVLTIHRSKGLEFPVVHYPYLWEPGWIAPDEAPVFHADGTRTIDVGGPGSPGYEDHRGLHEAEARGEELRLAYVALTRAEHQAVVWWAGAWESRKSALARLLFARDDEGTIALETTAVPTDEEMRARLAQAAADAPGCITVEAVTGGDGRRWSPSQPRRTTLRRAPFDRAIDQAWRRTSYSHITAGAHEAAGDAAVGSEPEEGVRSDEAMPAPIPPPPERELDAAALRAVPSLLADLPGGVDVGTFVHRVLEHTDFAAPDLHAEVAARIAEQRARWHVDVGDTEVLATGLSAALRTPLGPEVGDVALADVARGDRLDELWFELPLDGGDDARDGQAGRREEARGRGSLRVADVAALLRAHLPAADPLAGYGEELAAAPVDGDLRGYLAGSLDLVLRLPDGEGTSRFVVVDHKTNWLGVDGEPLSALHYRPAALTVAMRRAHYPLQALLYCVALHRYLRWRVPGYAPARHLGGVLYLFLRGMTGPDTPGVRGRPCGVFAWRPPAALVEDLSDLLDGGRS